MSLLTPLFLLGALAITAPLVLHLIRRSPRGQVPFSSLMFLAPTPPRLTRRSRLDQVVLLLLRISALVLLALAFARPFLREAASLNLGGPERKRVLILIDTSASLRRAGLWARAKAEALAAIDALGPEDPVAVFAFDATTRPVLSFDESATLPAPQRKAVARARVEGLEPTWAGTRLGQALVDAVSAVGDVADRSEPAGRMPRRVVLISDLQRGSDIEPLGGFAWPSDVALELKPVVDTAGNASLLALAASTETTPEPEATGQGFTRVRVANEPGSGREAFQLAWLDDSGQPLGAPFDAYVPPGESRVVRMPRPARLEDARTLRLSGDVPAFDNLLYFAPLKLEESTVLFVGDDRADDPNGLLYYLGRVFDDAPGRSVRVEPRGASSPLALDAAHPPALIVVAGEVSAANTTALRAYLRAGGSVLEVLTASGRLATLGGLLGVEPPTVEEAPAGRDAMLTEIAFDHPIFAPLAGPQFNDFTRIRFWKHRRLALESIPTGARVLARFEGGDPALVEQRVEKGRLLVLASGWGPGDGQLARTSKFVPLLLATLEAADPRPPDPTDLKVGDAIPLPPARDPAKPLSVLRPDGVRTAVESGATSFSGTDRPGIYVVEGGETPRGFAVNLDPLEGRTTPLEPEAFEKLGAKLAKAGSPELDREQARQMRNAELEGRQKLWRWLILATIGVLIVETLYAGRKVRPRAETAAP
jgi:hypothetical protein